MRVMIYILLLAGTLGITSCNNNTGLDKEVEETAPIVASEKGSIEVVDAATFAKATAAGNVQLIDVRTEREWTQGHLPEALHFEMNNTQWDAQIETLDKAAPVYVYCAKGGRSARCSRQLQEAGFTNIVDLEGGISAWMAEGYPVE